MDASARIPLRWEPLPDDVAIRILSLQPNSNHDSPLHGLLVTLSLEDESLDFEAISYAWGPAPPSFPCMLLVGDNSYLRITQSLDGALRALRGVASKRLLWADAVCINQDDSFEKAQQVDQMSQIFSRCTRTLVWLGEADESVLLAFKLCSHLSKNKEIYGLHTVYQFQDGCEYNPVTAENQRKLDQNTISGPALGLLLTRGWFWRRWMVQEVALAKVVEVNCGKYTLPWETLAEALAVIRLVEQSRGPDETGGWMADAHQRKKHFWEPAWAIAARRLRIEHTSFTEASGRQYLTDPPSSMLEVLSAASLFDCTDPRDYIFSLAALVDDLRFHSNYDETIPAVYRRLAETYLYEQGTCATRILHHARLPTTDEEEKLSANLPSYVPNWQILRTWGHFRLGGSGAFKFSAGFRERCSVRRNSAGHPEIRGFLLDNVRYVSLRIENSTMLRDELLQWLQISREDFEHEVQYLTHEPILTVMAKTLLVCNRLRPTRQLLGSVEDVDYAIFGSYLRTLTNSETGPEMSRLDPRLSSNFHSAADYGRFIAAVLRVLVLRRLAVTTNKWMMLVPEAAREGDTLVIFSGAETPFILREAPVHDGKSFKVVGECYVHGFMNWVDLEKFEQVMFKLV